MKKIFTLCILASFSIFFNSCLVPDDIKPDPIVFERLSNVPQVIPYQTVSFGGNKYPGIIQDYKVFFGSTEVPVSKITSDSIYVFVPFEVQVGLTEVKLVYKESEFNIGKVDILDWNTVSPHNVSYFMTKDAEHPYHITDSLSNSIIPHINGGVMDKIYISSYTGETSIIELNTLGLPSFYYNKKESFMFEGYDFEKNTVNIARFPTDKIEDAVYQYGVPVDPAKLKALKEANTGERKRNARYADSGEIFSHIGMVFDVTGCLVGATAAVIAPPTTFLTGAGLLISCSSAAYSVVKFINPEQDNKLGSHLQTVHGIKMNLINCLGLVGKKARTALEIHEGMYACYGLVLEAAKGVATLYDEFKVAQARDQAKMKAILNTGFGDIKITLDWNSTADIDLWVIDPSGEKIYYENEKSLSTQGELDLDDTDGYGPENIFWPKDQAPINGTYKVQVHYYGPDSGPSTSYRVIINNFGKSKTFRGSLSYNQVATIATFKANADWNNPGGRIAAPTITFADRNTLPNKK